MPNYNIPFSPPDITEAEIAEVADTLRSGWITTGPKTKELERRLSQYTQTPKTVCLNSATAALELILRVLEVGPGDEVIVPAMTYTASCSVITHVGATPVMVDIQADTFEMDYDLLEQAITEKTKVIIPVELAGIVCDYDRLFQVVEKNVISLLRQASGKKPLTVLSLSLIVPTLWDLLIKDNLLVLSRTLLPSHSTPLRTLQLRRVEVRLGRPIQRLMTKRCTRNSRFFPFMVKLRMPLPRCNWGHGNTISLHQPTSAI